MRHLSERLVVAILAALVWGVAGGTSLAQTPGANEPAPPSDRRPYRGLFGGGAPDATSGRSLGASGSLFGAYDDNIVAGLTNNSGAALDSRLQESGFYEGAGLSLSYRERHTGARSSWGTGGSASLFGYHTDEWKTVPRFTGALDAQWQLSRNMSLSTGYDLTYSTNYRLLLFPDIYGEDVDGYGEDVDGAVEGDPDTDLFRRRALRHGASVALSKTLDSRSTLSATYRGRYVQFTGADVPDLTNHAGSIGYDRRLTRHATLDLGYTYRYVETRFGGDNPTVQNINVGITYSRALSISRRTAISFSTGSSVVRNAPFNEPTRGLRSRVRLNGSASITHELGRSWNTYLSYQRRFLFREAFAEPFGTDAVSAGVAGLISRRLEFSAHTGWSVASIGDGQRNQHKGVFGTAQLRYGFTRFLAAYARYVYYRYRLGEDVLVAEGLELPRALDRNGVRVGITAFVPLIH